MEQNETMNFEQSELPFQFSNALTEQKTSK